MAKKSENKVRNLWDRERCYTKGGGELITEQSHERDCDLHIILNRFKNTGELPLGKTRGEPRYMDCPDLELDYKHMMDTVKRAESEFYRLPLEEQQKYGEKPGEWLRQIMAQELINPADSEAEAEGGEAPSEASSELNDVPATESD